VSCLHPEDRDEYERAIWGSLDTGGGFQEEYRVLGADGRVRWISGIGRAESNGNGAVHVRGVAIDITARKLAEIEAQQQRAELAHLSRVATLGELSGSLAHELNQPLTAILSNAQAAQRFLAKGGDLAEVREILEDIVKEDKHAGEVIRRLRPLLKKGEVNLETLDLGEVIGDALRVVRSDLLHRGVSVDLQLPPEAPPVRADRVQIQQVLLNLLANSCDALAGLEPQRRRIVLRVDGSESGPHVTVSDQGPGLPADADRIFEPFVTTKPDGIGLGLAVCRSIVAAHGGKLWAANNPERGATFHFTIPASGAAS
jgi:C4-dicarboxylate-specific signal transduction histidine kinase